MRIFYAAVGKSVHDWGKSVHEKRENLYMITPLFGENPYMIGENPYIIEVYNHQATEPVEGGKYIKI